MLKSILVWIPIILFIGWIGLKILYLISVKQVEKYSNLFRSSEDKKKLKKYNHFEQIWRSLKHTLYCFDSTNIFFCLLCILFWMCIASYAFNRIVLVTLDREYFYNTQSVYDIYDLPQIIVENEDIRNMRTIQSYNTRLRQYKFYANNPIASLFWYYDPEIVKLPYIEEKYRE